MDHESIPHDHAVSPQCYQCALYARVISSDFVGGLVWTYRSLGGCDIASNDRHVRLLGRQFSGLYPPYLCPTALLWLSVQTTWAFACHSAGKFLHFSFHGSFRPLRRHVPRFRRRTICGRHSRRTCQQVHHAVGLSNHCFIGQRTALFLQAFSRRVSPARCSKNSLELLSP